MPDIGVMVLGLERAMSEAGVAQYDRIAMYVRGDYRAGERSSLC